MTEINRYQARSLARFLHDLRNTLGPTHQWDTPGIEDAIWEARGIAPVEALAIACVKATINPVNRTPAIFSLQGPHWRESTAHPRHIEPHDGERCSVCYEPKARCIEVWSDDHRFLSIAETKRLANERRARAEAGT